MPVPFLVTDIKAGPSGECGVRVASREGRRHVCLKCEGSDDAGGRFFRPGCTPASAAQRERRVTETSKGPAGIKVGGETAPSRRDLLSLIGAIAGSTAMYHAMTSLGFAADSAYQGPIKLP